MELFGEKLREARESKKYTIDQVSRDTHISRQYIIAMENDDFQSFPGETYLIGFLRTYTEYLDLDPEHFINLYKNLKIQEEPLPFNELLEKRKKVPLPVIIISAVCGFALIAAAAVFLFLTLAGKPGTNQGKVKENDNEEYAGTRYTFNDEVMTEWFRKGDVVMIPVADKEYKLEIADADDSAQIRINDQVVTLSLLVEESFDLNADDRFDLSVVMNDYRNSDLGKEVNIGLYKITVLKPVYTEEELREKEAGMATTEPEPASTGERQPEITSAPNATNIAPTPVPTVVPAATTVTNTTTTTTTNADTSTGIIKIKEDTRVKLVEADKSAPFNTSIVFSGNCLFKYQIDGKEREERYFTKNETFEFPASREVIMWISNANSLKATIEGVAVNMGKPGQVVVKLVYWEKDSTTGKYSLDIVSLQ